MCGGAIWSGSRDQAVHETDLLIAANMTMKQDLPRLVALARALADARDAARDFTDAAGERIDALLERATTMSSSFTAQDSLPPAMLQVPIRFRGRVLGNLCLRGEGFTADDQSAVELLAAHAAIALENRHRCEVAARERSELRALAESINQGLLLIDRQEQVVFANRKLGELYEVDPAAVQGKFIGDLRRHLLANAADPQGTEEAIVAALQHPDTVHTIELGMARTAAPMLRITLFPVFDESGVRIGRGHLVQDVTAEVEVERLKDDFVARVSHEFRTPLTTIQGTSAILLNHWEQFDRETRHELLSQVLDQSQRLGRLLEHLLRLASVQAGTLAVEAEPILLRPLIQSLVKRVAEDYSSHRFEVDHVDGLPPVVGDEVHLEQVLWNLLDNAGKYTPPGTLVAISGRVHGQEVLLGVRDEGSGIAREEQARIFERFSRPGRASTGAGLGLYLARQLVEAMGGRIWVESEPNEGSTFFVSLPMADE
jgi:NtrC-family two-component system sensor histidine kinase KinB